MNNVFVYCEVEGTTVAEVSQELLTKGRKLANQQGVELHAIVAGTGIKGQVEDQILPYGVDKLFVFDAEGLFPYTSAPHTDILVNLFKEEKPQIALMGATVIGRDLGPRVSSSLTSGLTADCTELEIGDYDDKKSGKHYEGLLYQIRPAFGGNIVATIVNPEHRPQMATVRSGVMQKSIYEGECKKEVVYPEVSKYVPAEDFVVKVLDHHVEAAKHNLKGSAIVVAGGYGVDKLFVFDAEGLFPYTSAPHTDILVNLFKEEKPQIALMGATVIGRDLGPRVSSSLTSGLTADCTELEIGDYDDKKSGKHYEGLLYQIRPAFGGNIVATIVNPEHRPQMATVRSGVMQKSIYEGECKKEVVYPEVSKYVPAEDFVVKVLDHHVEAAKHNLKGSAIVVAGGYGVGSKEGFDQLFELAHLLHGEVGASRAAVDAGWVDHDRQIGQTGVTVHPKVYIACGISGQIQHIAGMQDSGIIISVNNDPDAPINKIADYVINGNVEDVVPKLIKYYKQNSK